MILLIANGVSRLTKSYCQIRFTGWGVTADNTAAAYLVVWNQAQPAGKAFARRESMQIFSHRRQQAKNSAVADTRDSKKVGLEVLVSYRNLELRCVFTALFFAMFDCLCFGFGNCTLRRMLHQRALDHLVTLPEGFFIEPVEVQASLQFKQQLFPPGAMERFGDLLFGLFHPNIHQRGQLLRIPVPR